ncbi:unnamed protein product [Parascedosporium putredinis]|uniref:DUF8004 domain-containing protein n=1 Tax=Parascedosporium putredinis TaxID=1442378 RepID=A0A9P1H5G3_9PEZI|nr:unnamed protein product [Parascedosporium putredinis]CAI7997904.1 unnamed protein product [Parascedosporium putredinis]
MTSSGLSEKRSVLRLPSPMPPFLSKSISAQPSPARDNRVLVKPYDVSASAQRSEQSPPRKAEKLRRSFLPGGRSRSNSHDTSSRPVEAWVISPMGSENSGIEYNTSLLVKGEKVPELWNDAANICVHLYPLETGHGPSFKIPSTSIASSPIFTELIQNTFGLGKGPGGRRNRLAQPSPFAIFMEISKLLEEFAFTSYDGLSFGQEVDLSFGFYIRQIGLGDVRNSREKTVEALVLGERMRSAELYNEAFAHAVGKYSAIVDLKSQLFSMVSAQTRQRLDRAHLDLLNRQHNVNVRIEQFDFPSLFAGVANSTSMTEFRAVRFKQWKNAFLRMRHFTLSYYKSVFGSWPPKASSRKNPFSESGLNRLVLKALYSDMCALYDLLADRQSLTPRVIDQGLFEMQEGDDPVITALRRMLSEFDNSSPPVLPHTL